MSIWKKLFGTGSKFIPAASMILYQSTSVQPAIKRSVVTEVKEILRVAKGALNFIDRAKSFGFRTTKEDFIGLYLEKGECTLILAVLYSRGPDSIWCLSMTENKGAEIKVITILKYIFYGTTKSTI